MELLNLKDSINQISFGNPKENDRVQAILCKAGITTLEQLCHKSNDELKAITKFSEFVIDSIATNLAKFGLCLGMNDYECLTYIQCRNHLLQIRKEFVSEINEMLEEHKDKFRYFDRDLNPEDYEDDGDYDEEPIHLALNIHNNLQLPKKGTGACRLGCSLLRCC